jgi:large subunit ribosomal protein L9
MKIRYKKLNANAVCPTYGSEYAAGADSKLYGSVTNKDLSEKLKADHKIDIDKRKITLAEPVKTFGTFNADAKLFNDVSAKIKFTVVGKK